MFSSSITRLSKITKKTPKNEIQEILSELSNEIHDNMKDQQAYIVLNLLEVLSQRFQDSPDIYEFSYDLCKYITRKIGCIPINEILCCETCSKAGDPKFIIDKNIKINDKFIFHNNNFVKHKDLENQAKDVLNYVSPTSFDTERRDEDVDIYIKEKNYVGSTMSYDEKNNKPKIFLDNEVIDGDILSEIFEYRSPYFVPFNPNPRNSNFDGETIHKYNIYDSDMKYEKLCFDDRSKPDWAHVCINKDDIDILNGEKDFRIINNKSNKCLGLREEENFKKVGSHSHPQGQDPASQDTSNTLFYGVCDDTSNTNRFKIENIKKIDSTLNLI